VNIVPEQREQKAGIGKPIGHIQPPWLSVKIAALSAALSVVDQGERFNAALFFQSTVIGITGRGGTILATTMPRRVTSTSSPKETQ
jgi:hypothetical protein